MSDVLPFDLSEQMLHSLGEGITFADREGRIVFSNEAADRILGVSATQAPADEWADHFGVFLPDHRTTPFPTDRYPLVRALEGEETAGVEMWIRNPENPDGVLISVTGWPLRDHDGRITGAAVVFRDITAEREAQEELERANSRLEEVQRQKDELSAFVVHDLKSPITGILLGAELLMESGAVEGDELQALRDIRDAAGTLHRMVLDLLDIRQADDAGLKPGLALVSIDGLLREVARALAPKVRATGVTMTIADGMGDLTVRADHELLQRVIRNLADNSLKYAPGGNVRMGARLDGPSVVLVYVEDDGPGVPEELRPRIFEIWTQAERTGEGRHRDSRGVGLHFCRLAVEAHGGHIRVEDSQAGGARFCVELPQVEGPGPTDGGGMMSDRLPFPPDAQDLGAILEAIPEFVLVMGTDGRILYLNRVEVGYEREDLVGMSAAELTAPASRDAYEEALASVLATGEPVEYDAEIMLPEAEGRWYRTRMHPFAGVEAEEAVLLVATDITELKAKEEELAQLRRLLPICSWCDKIQTEEGEWESVEAYLGREAKTQVSHGVCPDCYERKMAEMDAEDAANGDVA